MLTLLTATGCRPEGWKICEQLMARQAYEGPVRWVIVDDGAEPQPITFEREGWTLEVVRPTPYWSEGDNTQARNLLAGLEVIGEERVVIIEDDDFYSAHYLADVAKWLDHRPLAGECRARYYNVATKRGQQLNNSRHASLCSTAMRDEGLRAFRQVLKSAEKFIDMQLWRACPGRLYETRHVVGIKGLPGRGGIGCGHDRNFGRPMKLSDWIGEDAALYG